MLYLFFRVMMLFLSFMGTLSMIATESYTYVLFPIATGIWALYTFFDENDKEYIQRYGIKPRPLLESWLWPEDDYYCNDYNQYNYNGRGYRNSKTYTPPIKTNYNSPEYKKILKRCRKSVNVTIGKK